MALDNIPTLGPGSLNGNLDKVLVYKNGGSEVAVSLLTLTNSALNLSGIYLDTVNRRVGVNTNSPSVPFEVLGNALINATEPNDATLSIGNPNRRWDVKALQSGAYYQVVYQGNGVIGQSIDYLGNVAFGDVATLGARVGIKGSGSTSATTSLLVQNSSGTELFKVRDDGYVNISAGNGMNIGGLSFSGLTYNGVINFGNNDLSIGCNVNNRRVNLYSGNTNILTAYKSATNYGVGISDSGSEYPISSAVLQVSSTTRGFLKPKMTTAQKNAIATPTAGLEIYDTDLNRPCFYNGTSWITL
jgi:hypothetical protein